MEQKRLYLKEALDTLQNLSAIQSWEFTGAADRHDYQVFFPDGKVIAFEAKGCLGGNNTTIYQRPPNAEEFYIWSQCQNPGADPKHNVWSGIHTRLGAKIVADREAVSGLIVWDMLCGTPGRPCPKSKREQKSNIQFDSGRTTPPPCLYLFPKTVPDPRNNSSPPVWKLRDLAFMSALYDSFGCTPQDVIEVKIEARMEGSNTERKTTLIRQGDVLSESNWTAIKRANN